MKRVYYGWFVCLGGALVLFCTSGLSVNAFTVYQPYLISQNGFTNTQASTILTVRSLFSFFSMFLCGWYYKKLPMRQGLALSGLACAAGFFLFGLADSFLTYCLAAAVVGLAYGVGTMIPVTILMKRWFVRRRTLAIGICAASTGLATLGIPSLLTAMIESCGMRNTFICEAGFIGVLAFCSFLLVRGDPCEKGLTAYGEEDTAEPEVSLPGSGSRGLTAKNWILLVPMLLLLGAVTSVGFSHLSVLSNAKGFTPHVTALAIMASGITLMVGKILFGALADRITVYRCNWLFAAIILAGLVLLCLPGTNLFVLFAGSLLFGFGLALTTVGLSAWAGDLSTPEQYDTTVQRFQIGYSGGALLFSNLPGILADHFNGSYIPAYIFFTAAAVVMTLIVQYTYIKQRK